jgi:hypothetical protein
MKKEEAKKDDLQEGQIIETPIIRDRDTDLTDENRSTGEGTPIYLTPGSTLQSPEEHAHDEGVDPRLDTTMEVSNDDLQDIKAGKITGADTLVDDKDSGETDAESNND